MVAECLEVRARLKVRRCKCGVPGLKSGVDGEGAVKIGGGSEVGGGGGRGGVVDVSGRERLMGGECGSG